MPRGKSGSVRGDHDLNPGMEPAAGATPAAVLIPLIDRPGGVTVLFTRRAAHLDHHPGQISFPGGRLEPADNGPEDTALRETREEIGLDPQRVRLMGGLDLYHTRTGFLITPFVGALIPPLDLVADPFEVAEIFEAPLDFFLDPANHKRHSREYEGRTRWFHAMPYGEYYIWGATAGMLMNLYELTKK